MCIYGLCFFFNIFTPFSSSLLICNLPKGFCSHFILWTGFFSSLVDVVVVVGVGGGTDFIHFEIAEFWVYTSVRYILFKTISFSVFFFVNFIWTAFWTCISISLFLFFFSRLFVRWYIYGLWLEFIWSCCCEQFVCAFRLCANNAFAFILLNKYKQRFVVFVIVFFLLLWFLFFFPSFDTVVCIFFYLSRSLVYPRRDLSVSMRNLILSDKLFWSDIIVYITMICIFIDQNRMTRRQKKNTSRWLHPNSKEMSDSKMLSLFINTVSRINNKKKRNKNCNNKNCWPNNSCSRSHTAHFYAYSSNLRWKIWSICFK